MINHGLHRKKAVQTKEMRGKKGGKAGKVGTGEEGKGKGGEGRSEDPQQIGGGGDSTTLRGDWEFKEMGRTKKKNNILYITASQWDK